jgi:hypothetical protein
MNIASTSAAIHSLQQAQDLSRLPGGPRPTALRLTAAFLGVANWDAQGRDAQGRRIRLSSGLRQSIATASRAPADTSAGTKEIALPAGFSGRLTLHDQRGAALGSILLDKVGTPAFRAHSTDLDVRVQADGELIVGARSTPIRGYINMPAALNSARVRLLTKEGHVQHAAEMPSPAGVSMEIPPRFRGFIEVMNRSGAPVMRADVPGLHASASPVTVTAPAGFTGTARRGGGMLEINVVRTVQRSPLNSLHR